MKFFKCFLLLCSLCFSGVLFAEEAPEPPAEESMVEEPMVEEATEAVEETVEAVEETVTEEAK